MSYRDDIEALSQRVKSLESDVHAGTRELADARRLLDDAQLRGRLPVLDNIHVAAPCNASWDEMVGDDRARFCGSCDKNVYNLSAMTRPEAEALLLQKEGKLCVRYYQRADGTILTNDCAVGVRTRRRKRRIVAATFGALSALGAGVGAMLSRPSPLIVQGEMQYAPPKEPEHVPTPLPVKMGAVRIQEVPKPVKPPKATHAFMGHMTMGKPAAVK